MPREELKVGDRVTFEELRRRGYTQCPTGKDRDFTYWLNVTTLMYAKVIDGKVTAVFNE